MSESIQVFISRVGAEPDRWPNSKQGMDSFVMETITEEAELGS